MRRLPLYMFIAAGLTTIGICAFAAISHYSNAIEKQSTKLVAQAQSNIQGFALYIKGDYLKDQTVKRRLIQAYDPKTLK